LRLERQVDVLLECRWLDRAGDGVIPGKLFEYIGARRPILSLGSPTAEAAEIIRDNGFGLVSNDPAEIADRLRSWLEEKRRQGGRLPDLHGRKHEAFGRAAQFRRVDALIREALHGGAPAMRS
jgi:glycosyltransferase involved in cell wall biosynthesis